MSRFYASPSLDFSAVDASTSLLDFRERVRSGKHKYSLKRRSSNGTSLDTTLSSLAQSLRVSARYPSEVDEHERDADSLPSSKRICTTPVNIVRPSVLDLSPPPPPCDHSPPKMRPLGSPPKVIPLGDSLKQSDQSQIIQKNETEIQDATTNAAAAFAENPTPLTESIYQLRPNFQSPLLQNLVSTKPVPAADDIPEPPFRFVLPAYLPSPLPKSPYSSDNRQQPHEGFRGREEGSRKISVDMAVAPLSPSHGIFERANAA